MHGRYMIIPLNDSFALIFSIRIFDHIILLTSIHYPIPWQFTLYQLPSPYFIYLQTSKLIISRWINYYILQNIKFYIIHDYWFLSEAFHGIWENQTPASINMQLWQNVNENRNGIHVNGM